LRHISSNHGESVYKVYTFFKLVAIRNAMRGYNPNNAFG
jgi:hypothetical protein